MKPLHIENKLTLNSKSNIEWLLQDCMAKMVSD